MTVTMTPEAQRRHADLMASDATYREDALRERRRIGAILKHGLARGQHEQAKALALETDLPADTACRLLDTMPRPAAATAQVAVPATDFAQHLSRVQGCGRAAQADDTATAALLARARSREGRD